MPSADPTESNNYDTLICVGIPELDDFEEAPDVYQRMKAEICMTDIVEPSFKSLAENAIFKCWVYRIKNFRHGLLKKPLLRSYLSAEQRAYTEL